MFVRWSDELFAIDVDGMESRRPVTSAAPSRPVASVTAAGRVTRACVVAWPSGDSAQESPPGFVTLRIN